MYGFTDGAAQTLVTNSWSLTVPPYTTIIPAAYEVAANTVANSGFTGRLHQIDRSGGNIEFFSYGPNNQKIPINDRSNANAIKAYYAANVQQAPRITSTQLAAGSLTVVWINGGTLYSADVITGPWTSTGDSDGSFSESATGAAKFYQVRPAP